MSHAPLHPESGAGPTEAVPARFECTLASRGSGAHWVRIAGELDMATAPQVEQAVRQAEQRAQLIVLDLRALTFVDCAGIHMIVDASIRARSVGRRLMLVRGAFQVARVFALTGVLDAVEIVDADTAEEAVEAHLRRARADRVGVTRAPRPVVAFLSVSQTGFGAEGALIAHGVGRDAQTV